MAARDGLRRLASVLGRRTQAAWLPRLPHGLQVAADTSPASRPDAPEASGRSALSPLALLCGAAAAATFASTSTPALAEAADAPAPYTPEAASTSAGGAYQVPAQRRGMPKEIILYQYEVCPFCCKVKAFLDYHKVPYRTVEVSPLTKSELKWSEYRKVPVAVLDGEAVTDSSAIISRLAAELGAAPAGQDGGEAPQGGWGGWRRKPSADAASAAVAPAAGAADVRQEEARWRRWVDERFVRLITVNIYRSATESFQMFEYIADTGRFNLVEREATRVAGALLMWGISGRMRKKYGITGDVREELFAAADEWVAALGSRSFLGGDAPNLADLAVFGVIRSVTCTDTFNALMHSTGIGPWYARMMGAVGQSSRLSAS